MLRVWENIETIIRINEILFNKDKYYKNFKIPKKGGGYRFINQPIGELYSLMRFLLAGLERNQPKKIFNELSFAYTKKKNIVQNAKPHINKNIVINIDLKSYFESITKEQVALALSKYYSLDSKTAKFYSEIFTYKNHLPQGAPTSPFLANLVTYELDFAIYLICKKNHMTYTRYADDLTFSTNLEKYPKKTINKIRFVINLYGFKINYKKFRAFKPNKRQAVTGIVVNEKLNIKREEYKLIRAILHNWEKKGFRETERFFKIKFGDKDLGKYVEGKLNYFKMILGSENKKYIALKSQYLKVQKYTPVSLKLRIFLCKRNHYNTHIVVDETGRVMFGNGYSKKYNFVDFNSFNVNDLIKKHFGWNDYQVEEINKTQIQSSESTWLKQYINNIKYY